MVAAGSRGRGHAVTVDIDQVREWRDADEREAVILEIASALPMVLADAMASAHAMAEGIPPRKLAGVLAATWYVATTAVLDHLRERHSSVPEVTAMPESVERLQKIAR